MPFLFRKVTLFITYALVLLPALVAHAQTSTIIADTFGTNESYNTNSSAVISGAATGIGYTELAYGFIPNANFNLDRIDIALTLLGLSGDGLITLSLQTSDANGAPSDIALETYNVSVAQVQGPNGLPLAAISSLHPLLTQGQAYWIVVAPATPQTLVGWNYPLVIPNGLYAYNFGSQFPGVNGVWAVGINDPQGAFRVYATPVALPNTVTTAANVTGANGTAVTLSGTLKTIQGTPFNGKTLTFVIGGTTVGTAVTNASGVATLSYAIPPGTPAGNQAITVSFAGQGIYTPSSGTATLTVIVGKADTVITVANVTGAAGTPVTLTGTLKTSGNVALSGKMLTFQVGATTVGTAVTNSGGVATLAYAIPGTAPAGNQMITASFAGDTSNNLSSGTGTLTIPAPNTVTTVASVTGAAGTTVTLSGTLKTVRGTPFNGDTLTFKLGTTTLGTAVTNASGVATLSYAILPGTPAGNQTISVSFAGQGTYTPSSGTATLTIQ